MISESYCANYFSIDDIFVTQEMVKCQINNKLTKMGFLDPGSETENLEPGSAVNLPLWYIKELKSNHPHLTVKVPQLYKNVHKAVCEAETTHIDLGKIHPYFYEYGRYLTRYDRSNILRKILFETCRHRVRYLLHITKNTSDDVMPEHRLDSIENRLYHAGARTNSLFTSWLQQQHSVIATSDLVVAHQKKRKRFTLSDDKGDNNSSKRVS